MRLTGTTTPAQDGPGSNGIRGVFHILQSSGTGATPSDGSVSYPGYLLSGGSYYFGDIQ